MNGIIVSNLEGKHGAVFYGDIPTKVASGEIKYLECTKRGLEKTSELLLDVLTGKKLRKGSSHHRRRVKSITARFVQDHLNP